MLEGNVPLVVSTLNTFLMDIQPPGKRKNPVAYWKVKFDASQQLVRELEKKKNHSSCRNFWGLQQYRESNQNCPEKNKLLPKFMALRLEKMIADCPVN